MELKFPLNLSRNVALFDASVYDDSTNAWQRLKPEDSEAGAKQLLQAMRGHYIDRKGKPKAVNMDVSKLQYVCGLRPAARKLVTYMPNVAWHVAFGSP